MIVDGKPVTGTSIQSSISAGLGLVPEDRKTEDLIQELSVLKNIGLAKLADHGKMILNNKQEEADCMIWSARWRSRQQILTWP